MKTTRTTILPRATDTRMRLIVMSDSHGNDEAVSYIISSNPDADMFIHCGDMYTDHHQFHQLTVVKGNHDYEPFNQDLDDELILHIYNHRILVFHSDILEVEAYDDFPAAIAAYGKQKNCDMVLFGHFHRVCDCVIDSTRIISPGSLLFNFQLSEMGYYRIDFSSDGSCNAEFIPLPDYFQIKTDN